MTAHSALADRATRWWWRIVGREVDLTGEHAWLEAPMSDHSWVADGWVESHASATGGTVDPDGLGLLARIADLDGPGLATAGLHPDVVDFYERTTRWRMEVWTGWSWWARLPGAMITRWFGRRVGQLAIPTDPLAMARGMDSQVSVVLGPDGSHRGTGWHRTVRTTGEVVFSGFYGTRRPPGADRPGIHVAFPLEHGNVQVFLRPQVDADGALRLRSTPGRFGDPGTYVVVRHGRRTFAARVPVHEAFHVHVDAEGVLRTDHEIRLGRLRAVALHYRLDRRE